MKVLNFLKRDVKLGILQRLFLYLVPVLLAFMQAGECHRIFRYMDSENIFSSSGTIVDYLLYCMQGMFVFHFDPKEYFTIPIYWFIFQIYASYLIAYYANDDYLDNAKNLFVAAGNRTGWWNAKFLWCIASVVLYYIVYIVSIVAMACLFGGELKLSYTPEFVGSVFNSTAMILEMSDIIVIAILIPLFVTTGMCLVQLILGFITTPVVSFAAVSGVYIVSAYYTEWWLPGSYTMWLRSTVVTEEGVRPVSGILFGILMMCLAWYGGKTYFETKDVL